MNRLIKTAADYESALVRIDQLMGAEPGSKEGDMLDLLVTLVELYENQHYPIGMSDPIDAIKFVMEQNDLTPKDLVPYIGSRGKVSEILAGKRKLSLSMMRALNKHLGIPADILLSEPETSFPDQPQGIDWASFPLKEMAKRGWIEKARDLTSRAEEVMRGFIARVPDTSAVPLLRQGARGRLNSKNDRYALCAWCLRVLQLAQETELSVQYQPGTVNQEFLRRVARCSYFSKGPEMVKELLARHGIHLIVLLHLPKTYLDGAAMLLMGHTPVVGLTLRYDRVDNFWFSLLHELSHIGRHFDGEKEVFVDDHSLRKQESGNGQEEEADRWAEDALIPPEAWAQSLVSRESNESLVRALADEIEVAPAIIAGRIRFEQNNYRLLTRLVGQDKIRKHFVEFNV
ncbi:MAG: transcriptional regulator [Pseudomonadota bacterium]